MYAVDQDKPIRVLQARAAVSSAKHRAMLECVAEHIRAETYSEFDALMATMSPTPAFNLWVDGNGTGGGPKGLEQTTAHYRRLYDERRNFFELDIERIVVDDRTVVTEGWFRQIYPGSVIAQRGAPIDDVDAAYLVTMRLILLWPFDDEGRLIGEDSYASGNMFAPGNLRKLERGEVPPAFWG